MYQVAVHLIGRSSSFFPTVWPRYKQKQTHPPLLNSYLSFGQARLIVSCTRLKHMATTAPAPRPPHHLAAGHAVAPQQRRAPPTTDDVPPPLPKSPPVKPKKIVLSSPPRVIRDSHRGVAFRRCSFLGEVSGLHRALGFGD